ncbi:MAG: hypothetical protein K2Y25_15880 [Pseudomonadaceae bacterium]|nr:hypothetical protein [Pseudomonadaceae bacterium]
MSKEVVIVKAVEAVAPTFAQGVLAVASKTVDVVAKHPVGLAAVITTGACVVACAVSYHAIKNASEITWGKFKFKGKS